MAIIKVSDLPVKASLDDTDRVVGYSTSTGGTSLLLGSSFAAIQTSAQKSADSAAASAASASSLKTDMEADISAAKSAMATAQTDGVKAVQTAQTTGVSAVQSAQAEALSAITLEKTSGVAAVKEAGEAAQTAANSAAESASSASASATAASGSASSAKSYADAASASATNAATSENNASASASAAAASQSAVSADKAQIESDKEAIQAAVTQAVTQAVTDAKLAAHPVGSIYCSVDLTDPKILFGGTWERVSSGRVLQSVDSSHAAGTTAEAGLPNITGSVGHFDVWGYGAPAVRNAAGAFEGAANNLNLHEVTANDGTHTQTDDRALTFDASRSSTIYGASSTVQPPAFFVYIWKRTA